MILKTANLNRAAFFTTLGGTLLSMQGKYPEQVFVVRVSKLLVLYERIGFISYKRYANQRIKLKHKSREFSGLPKKFTGDNKGFQLQDVARITPQAGRAIAALMRHETKTKM